MASDEPKSGLRGLALRLKPAAPAWVQFLAASLLWTAVGTFLLYRGLSAAMAQPPWILALVSMGAGLIGFTKGLLVMRPVAIKGSARIALRGDGKCVMGFISWKSWLFVIGMAVFGKFLRSANLPGWILGVLLGGVGIALLIGAGIYWTDFFKRVAR